MMMIHCHQGFFFRQVLLQQPPLLSGQVSAPHPSSVAATLCGNSVLENNRVVVVHGSSLVVNSHGPLCSALQIAIATCYTGAIVAVVRQVDVYQTF